MITLKKCSWCKLKHETLERVRLHITIDGADSPRGSGYMAVCVPCREWLVREVQKIYKRATVRLYDPPPTAGVRHELEG